FSREDPDDTTIVLTVSAAPEEEPTDPEEEPTDPGEEEPTNPEDEGETPSPRGGDNNDDFPFGRLLD
ncbi:MAG: hypothetical protein ACRDO7_07890, partial [Nocardioidaceae bacterium]